MSRGKRHLWYLVGAMLLFVAFIFNVFDNGETALSAILHPTRATPSDWWTAATVIVPLMLSIGFGAAGFLRWRAFSVR